MVKKLLAVVFLILLSAGAAVGGAYLHHSKGGSNEEKEASGHSPEKISYEKIEKSLTVPVLKDSKVITVVVAEVTLEITNEEIKDAIRVKQPRLRDAFLQVFYQQVASGNFEETMLTEKVQAELRRDLLKAARGVLGVTSDISAVIITDIQRQDV
jgi:flagellar protein FliL